MAAQGQPTAAPATGQTITVGEPAVIEAAASSGPLLAVFEDDGETGYFYAVDSSKSEQPIQDAVHVYNVRNVTDRSRPWEIKIQWSADSQRVMLMINNYPHAAFDFVAKHGYARTNFPPAGGGWVHLPWDDRLVETLR